MGVKPRDDCVRCGQVVKGDFFSYYINRLTWEVEQVCAECYVAGFRPSTTDGSIAQLYLEGHIDKETMISLIERMEEVR